MANLPMTIVVLGGGLAFLWVGVADPQGGVAGLVGSVMKGQVPKPHTGSGPAVGAALGALLGGVGSQANGGGSGDVGGAIGGALGGVAGAASSSPVVQAAARYLGTPYVWGGGGASGPSSGGFDCSGLTEYAYHAAYGITIPRVAATQQASAQRIQAAQAQPGDLVFFGAPAYHVGIVVGNGQMIHAPHTGTVVKYEAISDVTPGPVTYGRFGKAVGAAT